MDAPAQDAVKVTYKDELRRVPVGAISCDNFGDFVRTVTPLFSSLGGAVVRVTYTDEEGDVVTVRTSQELREAFRTQRARNKLIKFQLDAETSQDSSISLPCAPASPLPSPAPCHTSLSACPITNPVISPRPPQGMNPFAPLAQLASPPPRPIIQREEAPPAAAASPVGAAPSPAYSSEAPSPMGMNLLFPPSPAKTDGNTPADLMAGGANQLYMMGRGGAPPTPQSSVPASTPGSMAPSTPGSEVSQASMASYMKSLGNLAATPSTLAPSPASLADATIQSAPTTPSGSVAPSPSPGAASVAAAVPLPPTPCGVPLPPSPADVSLPPSPAPTPSAISLPPSPAPTPSAVSLPPSSVASTIAPSPMSPAPAPAPKGGAESMTAEPPSPSPVVSEDPRPTLPSPAFSGVQTPMGSIASQANSNGTVPHPSSVTANGVATPFSPPPPSPAKANISLPGEISDQDIADVNDTARQFLAQNNVHNTLQARNVIQTTLDQLPTEPGLKHHLMVYNLAWAHARLGEKGQMMKRLRQSVALGFKNFSHLLQNIDLGVLGEPQNGDIILSCVQNAVVEPQKWTSAFAPQVGDLVQKQLRTLYQKTARTDRLICLAEAALAAPDRVPRTGDLLFNAACLYAQVGKQDQAVELIWNAMELGFLAHESVLKEPAFRSISSTNEAFKAVLAEMRNRKPSPTSGSPFNKPPPARASGVDYTAQVREIKGMGFEVDDDTLRAILEEHKGDIQKAIQVLVPPTPRAA